MLRITNLIIAILIILFLGYSFQSKSQNLKRRETRFNNTIQLLENSPERLTLTPQPRYYPIDSLQDYYNHISADYVQKEKKLNNAQRIFWLYEIGLLQISLDSSAKAIDNFDTAIRLLQTNPAGEKNDVRLLTEKAYALRELNKFKESNRVYEKLIKLPRIKNDTTELMHCYYFIAENYEYLGEYQKAFKICQRLYSYSYQKGNYANASYNLIQLGRLSSLTESDTSYLEYFHLANELALKSGADFRIGNNLASTGYAYFDEGFYYNALHYFIQGESYSKSFPKDGYLYLLNGLSKTYLQLDSTNKALNYALKSKEITKTGEGSFWLASSYEVIAECFTKLKQADSAKYYLQQAIELNKDSKNGNNYANLYRLLSDVYTSLNNYPAALAALDSSYFYYNKFISKTTEDRLDSLRIESDYYIHKSKIAELVSNNQLQKQKNRQLTIIVSAIFLFLLLSTIFVFLYRKQLKDLKESYFSLIRKNIELDRLTKQLKEQQKQKKEAKSKKIKDEDLIVEKLNELFYETEIFTDPDLTLKMLADKLETNTSYLSAIINSHFNGNLKNLINNCRINKVRKMLISEDYKHLSMEGMAKEVGFKSRSGFYQAFKSVTGVTPSIYLANYTQAIERNKA